MRVCIVGCGAVGSIFALLLVFLKVFTKVI